mmetsp:Transcript_6011/g.15984  ORF Transcript_6011/g.15984 Transcript_6011/m.15984 type:complete len:315 (+) Transcript_6011:63-1007(+)
MHHCRDPYLDRATYSHYWYIVLDEPNGREDEMRVDKVRTQKARVSFCVSALKGTMTRSTGRATAFGTAGTLVWVTSSGCCRHDASLCATAEEVLAAGVDVIHLRDLSASTTELHRTALAVSRAVQRVEDRLGSRKRVVLNVNFDVSAVGPQTAAETELSRALPSALLLRQLDGLHFPEHLVRYASRISDRTKSRTSSALLVGSSVHSVASAARAVTEHGVDYLHIGTMFPTTSHIGKVPEGPALLSAIRDHPDIPKHVGRIAVGGVDASNASAALLAGATGVASIRAAASAPSVRQLRLVLDAYPDPNLRALHH